MVLSLSRTVLGKMIILSFRTTINFISLKFLRLSFPFTFLLLNLLWHFWIKIIKFLSFLFYRDVDITVESAGVRVTLIDFTLSRLVTPEGEVAFCDLAADPELFNGPKGDAQVSNKQQYSSCIN